MSLIHNRMEPTDKTVTYAYNGEGYRVEKTENGKTAYYLYEADKVILETDGAGNQTSVNTYGINLISRTMDSQTAYYMYNGHADVTALVTENGQILASYRYDAFGNTIEKNENTGLNNPYRYAGYRYDSETDLYYLNARYYDSKIARFMTEDTYTGDPNDPLSLNLYTYCHNEPIMYMDSTGHVRIAGGMDYSVSTKKVGNKIIETVKISVQTVSSKNIVTTKSTETKKTTDLKTNKTVHLKILYS